MDFCQKNANAKLDSQFKNKWGLSHVPAIDTHKGFCMVNFSATKRASMEDSFNGNSTSSKPKPSECQDVSRLKTRGDGLEAKH
jgi:hypothetical protein